MVRQRILLLFRGLSVGVSDLTDVEYPQWVMIYIVIGLLNSHSHSLGARLPGKIKGEILER